MISTFYRGPPPLFPEACPRLVPAAGVALRLYTYLSISALSRLSGLPTLGIFRLVYWRLLRMKEGPSGPNQDHLPQQPPAKNTLLSAERQVD